MISSLIYIQSLELYMLVVICEVSKDLIYVYFLNQGILLLEHQFQFQENYNVDAVIVTPIASM